MASRADRPPRPALGRWVMPFTECRLPGVVYAVTITLAPLLAQLPPLAVVLHAVSPRVARSHRSGTSLPLNLALRWCLAGDGCPHGSLGCRGRVGRHSLLGLHRRGALAVRLDSSSGRLGVAGLDIRPALALSPVTGCTQRQAKMRLDLDKLLGQDLAKRLQPLGLGLYQEPLTVRLVPGTPVLLARRGPFRLGVAVR